MLNSEAHFDVSLRARLPRAVLRPRGVVVGDAVVEVVITGSPR